MAFGDRTIQDFGGGVGNILSGYATAAADDLKAQGLFAESKEYALASSLAGKNEDYAVESTAVTQAAIERNFQKASGQTDADIAGAGFTNSGSAQDIMRENASQGAIAHQIAGQQGLITEAGYDEQKQSYEIMSKTAQAAGEAMQDMGKSAITNGWITGGISMAAGIATLA